MKTECISREYKLGVEWGIGVCARCKRAFEYPRTVGRFRKYCEECRPIVSREQKNRILREYRQTTEGKAATAISLARYIQSPEGKASAAESHARYDQTPKGKTAAARRNARRRERSTDPESYVARVELLHTMQEPCANCKALYRITHQIDHIVALCLGGTDEWFNLQPLCVRCHRRKSGEDTHKLIDRHRRHT